MNGHKGLNKIITKEFLIQKHEVEGKSIRQIARDIGCSHSNLRKYFKKYGISSITKMSDINKAKRLYYINEDYFKVIDSKQKAYWFGFLYADAYMLPDDKGGYSRLRFLLAEKDRVSVENFRDAVGEPPVKTYKTGAYVDIHSNTFCSHLKDLNMTSPKTDRIGLPIISHDYFYSFLLGLFDGDGSFVFSNGTPTVSLLGSEELMQWVKKKLSDDGIVYYGKNIDKIPGIYRLAFSSKVNMPLFYKLMYTDNPEVLPMLRKKNSFENYLTQNEDRV